MDREQELTFYLVTNQIPFNPPYKGAALTRLQANNPDGYAKLVEFLELKAAQKENDNE